MKNLYQKINDVMLEVQSVIKGAKVSLNSTASYKAVLHDDVTALLHMPVARAGIVLVPSVIESTLDQREYTDKYGALKIEYKSFVTVELVAIDSDSPETSLKLRMTAYAFDNSDKACGKAISMATKYCYLKLFMLESVDNEEDRPENYQESPLNKAKEFVNNKLNINKSACDDADNIVVVEENIKHLLSCLTIDMKTMKEKSDYMMRIIGVKGWSDIEKMNLKRLVEAEDRLMVAWKEIKK